MRDAAAAKPIQIILFIRESLQVCERSIAYSAPLYTYSSARQGKSSGKFGGGMIGRLIGGCQRQKEPAAQTAGDPNANDGAGQKEEGCLPRRLETALFAAHETRQWRSMDSTLISSSRSVPSTVAVTW